MTASGSTFRVHWCLRKRPGRVRKAGSRSENSFAGMERGELKKGCVKFPSPSAQNENGKLCFSYPLFFVLAIRFGDSCCVFIGLFRGPLSRGPLKKKLHR